MKISNDYYKHRASGAWTYGDEREVYITDDQGELWRVQADAKGGLEVTAVGGDSQIAALARAGNQLTLRAERP